MVCGRGYAFVSRQVQLTLVETVFYGLGPTVCNQRTFVEAADRDLDW